MRAALLELWPLLSDFYGIRPPDLPLYSIAEISQYVDDLPKAQERRIGIQLS